MTLLVSVSGWLRPYNDEIALAIIATLLVVFGDRINRLVRKLVRPYWVGFRVLAFVALCTFGYGTLTVWLVPVLAGVLISLAAPVYVASIVGSFVVLGILAEGYHKK
ncbi:MULTISPECIES: DUF3392 family protein [unclassified Oceanobacter]|jgi:hypothetical protein|uniref:DUF3392 family protein n=1 Tax=unclassified Oceanobacter TaxID=2620260 RepID=UPI0026E1E547|nr:MULTISPECIES: DUF3392 family protein [unclassified Oceanobacter]MDO6683413.1 DUF3392 family protein [Oceanobacter sp. 5_MG-2023]MDP2506887.1 DUF3392 family protein [Oceanobacter sp. 3_MG-2023]MDP2608440.1 DUF3392 family protein [Oceanobacter sp. 1_MG-2023]MDP2611535.1 DUF3392 family protein [Oceanobacter sp. 2_MG-2023]